jgi:hypothetical protein
LITFLKIPIIDTGGQNGQNEHQYVKWPDSDQMHDSLNKVTANGETSFQSRIFLSKKHLRQHFCEQIVKSASNLAQGTTPRATCQLSRASGNTSSCMS